MEEYYDIFLKSGLFNGIQPKRYKSALDCLNAKIANYKKGTHIIEIDEACNHTGIVLQGTLEEFIYDEDGNQVNICRFSSGQVFGAEMACSHWTTSPVCLMANTDCTVLLLNFNTLLAQHNLNCPCRMQVTANLMQSMAQQMLFFNTKIHILAQKRLRDRLRIYLNSLSPDKNGCYNLPYNRSELADFLCVDRSALSRELCRLRDDGLINFSGSKIWILKDSL